MSQAELTRRIFAPYRQVNALVNGRGRLTTDLALRLGKFVGTTETLWLNMQLATDLYRALNDPELKKVHRKIKPLQRLG